MKQFQVTLPKMRKGKRVICAFFGEARIERNHADFKYTSKTWNITHFAGYARSFDACRGLGKKIIPTSIYLNISAFVYRPPSCKIAFTDEHGMVGPQGC